MNMSQYVVDWTGLIQDDPLKKLTIAQLIEEINYQHYIAPGGRRKVRYITVLLEQYQTNLPSSFTSRVTNIIQRYRHLIIPVAQRNEIVFIGDNLPNPYLYLSEVYLDAIAQMRDVNLTGVSNKALALYELD